MESDKLVEIPPSEWIELRELFSNKWPENHVAWHTIDNYVNWFRTDPNTKHLKIYSLNGTWRSDGTYIVIDRYQIFIYTLEFTNEKLKRALKLLDWSIGLKVSSFLKRHRSAVLDTVQEKRLKIEYDSHTPLYFLAKEDAQKLTLLAPSNVILKPLSISDAEVVDNEWPNKHVGSLFFIQRLIERNPNIAAFDENGELMAWCLRLQSGPLGALQVGEKFKRRGIASLLIVAMCKILANMNQDTFALVNYSNFAASHMFVKLGFKEINDAYWLRNYPSDETFEWSDD